MITNSAIGKGAGDPRPFPWFVVRDPDNPPKCKAPEQDDTFFPPKPNRWANREAKQICRNCPLRADCLDYAVKHEPRFGNWAGTTPGERRRLKKKKNLPVAPAPALAATA